MCVWLVQACTKILRRSCCLTCAKFLATTTVRSESCCKNGERKNDNRERRFPVYWGAVLSVLCSFLYRASIKFLVQFSKQDLSRRLRERPERLHVSMQVDADCTTKP